MPYKQVESPTDPGRSYRVLEDEAHDAWLPVVFENGAWVVIGNYGHHAFEKYARCPLQVWEEGPEAEIPVEPMPEFTQEEALYAVAACEKFMDWFDSLGGFGKLAGCPGDTGFLIQAYNRADSVLGKIKHRVTKQEEEGVKG